jgi:hypothetical protein
MVWLRVSSPQPCPAWGADQLSASSAPNPGGTLCWPPHPRAAQRDIARRNGGGHERQSDRRWVASGVTADVKPRHGLSQPEDGLAAVAIPPVCADGPAAAEMRGSAPAMNGSATGPGKTHILTVRGELDLTTADSLYLRARAAISRCASRRSTTLTCAARSVAAWRKSPSAT